MTQIELLSCPFCGLAGKFTHGVHGGYAMCSGDDCPGNQIRTPAWHWNTRSDTREQATASPSAVGEGLTFDAFRLANVARCIKWHPQGIGSWSPSDWLTAVTGELGELASLLKMRNRERDGLPGNKFSPTDKQVADELADVLTYLDLLAAALGVDLGRAAVEKFNEVSERVGFPDRIALSSQAPKPASAGVLDGACPFCHGVCDGGMAGPCDYCKGTGAVAAEADTAKVCAECGGIDRYHVTTCSKSLLIETLAADRLAPIEARGVESNYYQDFFDRYGIPSLTKPSCFACGHAKDERGIEHAVLPNMYICTDCVSAIRARESAPAVEPSVATGCAGEVTEEMVNRAWDAFMGCDPSSTWAKLEVALQAALSQPTRAAGDEQEQKDRRAAGDLW